MNDDFIVAVDYTGSTFSITCRRLSRNKHWKRRDGNPACIYDSRDPNPRLFTIIFEGPEVKAKFFAESTKMNYAYQEVKQVTVKSDQNQEFVDRLFASVTL